MSKKTKTAPAIKPAAEEQRQHEEYMQNVWRGEDARQRSAQDAQRAAGKAWPFLL